MPRSFVVLWGVLFGLFFLTPNTTWAQDSAEETAPSGDAAESGDTSGEAVPEEAAPTDDSAVAPDASTDAAEPTTEGAPEEVPADTMPIEGASGSLDGSTGSESGDASADETGEESGSAEVFAEPEPEAPEAKKDSYGMKPLGFAGGSFGMLEDRWRIGFPHWSRYAEGHAETPYQTGDWWNPYAQNVLKGDYPIYGQDLFMDLSLVSDSLFEMRSSPVPSGVSTDGPRDQNFFADFDQFLFTQNLAVSFELFKGDTAFRPKDWALKATAVANGNYVEFTENNAVNVDVRDDTTRSDGHIGMQELFLEYHLSDLSPYYDFMSVVGGIQQFNSDFRGFLYSDNNLGVRAFGNCGANRVQWNLAWFPQLEKDTNSGLNKFDSRDQNVFVANLYIQDMLVEGYTGTFSYHGNLDDSDTHFDDNGFLVRPARIGTVTDSNGRFKLGDLEAHYLGWGGDGHVGRLNLSHQHYFAFGRDQFNQIAGRKQNIRAHMHAVETSVDFDWLRLKASMMHASGDKNPDNGHATGFDSILDNPFFAGAGFSYWNRQNVALTQTGVQLVNRLSLYPNLRSSKIEGKANFVNPGLWLYNVGASARISPKWSTELNVNFLRFAEKETLEKVLVQDGIDRSIGVDTSLGFQYRPLLTENVIFTFGGSVLPPGRGFRQLYSAETLYSGFAALTLTY